MGKIHRRRFPRRWPTRRHVPAAVIWAAVSRVVARDGRPRPISSSWTGSAASIKRLLTAIPCRSSPALSLVAGTGTEVLNSGNLNQGFAGGPRVDLIRHGDSGYDLELSYFQIDGWSNARSIGPDDPPDWLVMRAPGLHANQSTHGPGDGLGLCYETSQCGVQRAMESLLPSNHAGRIPLGKPG